MAEHPVSLQARDKNIPHQLRVRQPTYETIPHLRRNVISICQRAMLSPQDTDAVALTLSEIMTNLIKHPAQKAENVLISLSCGEDIIELDIADDSASFKRFTEKCKAARARPSAAENLREGGYGLHCILSLQTEVSYIPAAKSADHLNHFITRRSRTRQATALHLTPGEEKKPLIFLVDDDRFSLQTTHIAIEDEFQVVGFSSAAEALAAFPGLKPDIVVSDFYMPGMNGADLRRSLSKTPEGNLTPFVFLSGGDEKNMTYLSTLGIDDFLQKPIDARKLKNILHRLLHRSRQIKKAHTGDFENKISSIFQPRLPKTHDGWSFAVRHALREAGGGDFILYHYAASGMNILLADVMGHGVEAKFFSYAYAGYLRGLFRMYGHAFSPAEILSALSRGILDDPLLKNTVVTCLALHIGQDGWVKIASAGHPPPLLFKNGIVENIDVRGPLPGLASTAKYDDVALRLEKNESLVIGTDGFFDRMPGVLRPLEEKLTGEDVAERLWAQAKKAPVEERDDQTLAVLRYEGKTNDK